MSRDASCDAATHRLVPRPPRRRGDPRRRHARARGRCRSPRRARVRDARRSRRGRRRRARARRAARRPARDRRPAPRPTCWAWRASSSSPTTTRAWPASPPTTAPARSPAPTSRTPPTRLAAILREEHAEVLTIYDERGGYGHPDHVQVHDVGPARAARSRAHRASYAATVSKEHFLELQDEMQDAVPDGVDTPDPEELDLGVPDARITTTVDVTSRARPQAGGDGGAPEPDRRRVVLPRPARRRVPVVPSALEWFIRLDETPAEHETWIF